MRQTKSLILAIACAGSVAFCVVLALQLGGIVPPIGVGWGDGTKGRAYLIGMDGAIVFETLAGVKPLPPGMIIGTEGRPSEMLGFQYHRWSLIALKADRTRLPGVYSTKITFRIAMGWPVLLSLAFVSLYVARVVKQRRWARAHQLCRNCGYDLRATPDRCPECGLVPEARAAG